MDMELVGRHALLFDDDAMLKFVNSTDALVEWHSLPIDRYDVRHLLDSPPTRRSNRNSSDDDGVTESELDYERYRDLPSPVDEDDDKDITNGDGLNVAGAYHTVGFSYGISEASIIKMNANTELDSFGFHPPFHVPENLRLPPTEKLHQIIARTALFVSKHGGQSEIVLRVKQGDNPTFGFLMPDHHLHEYFRFLVDHQELMEKKVDNGHDQVADAGESGALSLLGSIYGSGEDEDGPIEYGSKPKASDSSSVSNDIDPGKLGHSEITKKVDEKDKVSPEHPALTSKDKALPSKKIHSINSKKESEAPAQAEKPLASALPCTSKVENPVLEPPSELKKLVEKIVEFILKNGKEFEAVLVKQDTKYGRFPFLLPSNLYYSYYLKALEKAQESKASGNSFISEKDDLRTRETSKKIKESDAMSVESAGSDIPFDSDRKEKFKMVINKPKKDAPDQPSKSPDLSPRPGMDAAAAAAIIQAARKGIKYPNLESFSKTSLNGASVSVPEAKEIAKTAALIAASEADSSEAGMTRDQKIKAERLKRAKMFASMIKGRGAALALKPETLRGLSVERPDSGASGSGLNNAPIFSGKEREGSSVPLDADNNYKLEGNNHFDEEQKERRPKRTYRSKTKTTEADVKDEDSDDEDKEHSRKKHRSSRHSRERHKHRRIHSSSRYDSYSDEEHEHRSKSRKHSNDSYSDEEHKHRSKSRKHSRRSRSGRDTDFEEGEITNTKSDQAKASPDLSNSYQEARAPSQPPEISDVPDELRAKIRAMLMATM